MDQIFDVKIIFSFLFACMKRPRSLITKEHKKQWDAFMFFFPFQTLKNFVKRFFYHAAENKNKTKKKKTNNRRFPFIPPLHF